MTTVLVDTSVLLEWFHSDGESELVESRAIREAARRGLLAAGVAESPSAVARRRRLPIGS